MLAIGWFLRVTLRKVDWQKDFHRQRWVTARKPFSRPNRAGAQMN